MYELTIYMAGIVGLMIIVAVKAYRKKWIEALLTTGVLLLFLFTAVSIRLFILAAVSLVYGIHSYERYKKAGEREV